MRKISKIAFAMALATSSLFTTVTAQTKELSVYVGKKCPSCDVLNLQKWDYEMTGYVETFSNPDFNSKISVDWLHMTVETNTGEVSETGEVLPKSYKITKYKTPADKNCTQIWYGGLILTKWMNDYGQYIGQSIEDEKEENK